MENTILLAVISACVTILTITVLTGRKKNAPTITMPTDPMKHYIDRIEYSERVLTFIRQFTVQISVITFRQFIDDHEIDKITKAQIQKLVTETALEVNRSFSQNPIMYDELLLTKEFVDKYIIQTSILSIKDLLDKTVNESNS